MTITIPDSEPIARGRNVVVLPIGLADLSVFLAAKSTPQGELGITIDAYRWRTQIAKGRKLSGPAAFTELRDTVRTLPYYEGDPEQQDSIQLRYVVDAHGRSWLLRTGWSKNHVSVRVKLLSGSGAGSRITAIEMMH